MQNRLIEYAILISCAVVALLYFGPCKPTPDDAKYQKEIAVWKDSVAIVNKQSEIINHLSDSVKQSKTKSDSEIVVLNKHILNLNRYVDSIRTDNNKKLQIAITTLPDTCKIAIDAAVGFKRESDSLYTEVGVWQSKDSKHVEQIQGLTFIDSLLVRDRDKYKKLVENVPIFKQSKIFGFIPMPSRKQSLIIGIVGGIVIAKHGNDIVNTIIPRR